MRGFVLMEDLGDALYLPALNAGSADRLYGDAVGALLRMQRDVPVHDLPAYDRHRLRQELDLLRIWFLSRHLDAKLQRGGEDALEAGFHALIENALEQPQVFVHRDFHSRNLLIVDRNSPGILDFQDAVCGPVTYDLVSLLRDCYIEWQPSRVEEWVDNYRVRAVAFGLINSDPVTFRRWFDWMGVQRHLKVLGIFCRLWYRDGKRQYLGDLPRVWGYVREVSSAYTELQPLHECLERCIGDRDLTEPAD